MARLPDFFIVGHPKCGTTALYEALRQHPDIYMSAVKEPAFMAAELRYRPDWGGYAGLPKTLDEYLLLFEGASPEQRAGEASAWYLWSHTAAANIAELQPDAHIVAILREPVAFLRSLHLQCVQAHVEPEKDLRKAIALEDRRRQQPGTPPHAPSDWPRVLPAVGGLIYSDYVRYVAQLRRYRELFPPENLLVLIYDDFRAENAATVRTVLRFLGIAETSSITVSQANPSVRVRSRRLNDLLRALYMGEGPFLGAVKKGVQAVVPSRRLRRQAIEAVQHRAIYADPPPPDEELANELRERFKPEVVALSEQLDRDLVTLWGY